MRLSVAIAVTCLATIGLSVADESRASISKHTEIPAQDLASALQTLAKERGFQVVFVSEDIGSKHTEGAVGDFTPEEALTQLLKGTGLTYRYLDDKTVTVLAVAHANTSSPSAGVNKAADAASSGDSNSKEGSQSKSLWEQFRVAQVAQDSPALGTSSISSTARTGESSNNQARLEEVVVTAEKRAERLHDVPVPVTAVNAQALLEANELKLQDYYSQVPGLVLLPGSSPSGIENSLSIRGITTGVTNPTVGYAIDDVPFGSVTNLGGGNQYPDLDPDDLARIEVLRGPQGTLYGASSLGGLIKFVTTDPSTEAWGGRLEAGTTAVRNGSGLGYSLRGAANIPIADSFALRATGFTRKEPGYIDNPITGISGVNEEKVSGGRLSALWKPSSDISVKLSALYQDFKGDGPNDITPGLGDLQQNYVRGIGSYSGSVQAYSANLAAKLGRIDLAVISGYNVRQAEGSIDYSSIVGGLAQPLYGFGGVALKNGFDTKKFTQEIRLSGSISHYVDGLLGLFYTHEDSPSVQDGPIVDPASGGVVADGFHLTFPTTYTEYAAFADLTFHLTPRLDLQLGARQSHIKQVNDESVFVLPLFANGDTTPIVTPPTRATSNPSTYLVTPSFKFSPDLMLYARFATGYRVGGANVTQCATFGFPCQYAPDKTQNYELGVKGDFLNHRLSVDTSIYYIDWINLQISANDPKSQLGFTTNAGGAKSQGLELSIEAKPVGGFTIAAWGAWNDAQLTEPFPPSGNRGDRMPYTSRLSGGLSLEEVRAIAGNAEAFAGISANYIGNRLGDFALGPTPTQRNVYPGYSRADLRVGLRYKGWTTRVFLNNVFDKRGLDGGLDFAPRAYIYTQPRTIGLAVAKRFD